MLLILAATLILLWAVWFIQKYLIRDVSLYIKEATNHHWTPVNHSEAHVCGICSMLLTNGDEKICDYCGLCCDIECLQKAEKIKCKEISCNDSQNHHWVKVGFLSNERGNDALCVSCGEECLDDDFNLQRCCWCQRVVHSDCCVDQNCDFGEFQRFIIPPQCVKLVKHRIRRKLKAKSIAIPPFENWTPVIVIANRSSGNSEGCNVLSYFRRVLNPCQVIDLSKQSPSDAIQRCSLLSKHVTCHILVAGGDGSVAWLLNTIHDNQHVLNTIPNVGIIPLGTGNDLSRVLGWGEAYDPNLPLSIYLRRLTTFQPRSLDRWQIMAKTARRLNIPVSIPGKRGGKYFYNYFSVGVDAGVALEFHKEAVAPSFTNLTRVVEVRANGRPVPLPPDIEGVLVMNISSWAAGVDVWGSGNRTSGEFQEQKMDDGVLEIVGINSSFHVAQLTMGLSEPHRLGQSNNITIKLSRAMPVQADGEPWMQNASEIDIVFVNKAKILAKCSEDEEN